MGAQRVVSVDLASRTVRRSPRTGNGPRHLVRDPDGRYLYVTQQRLGHSEQGRRAHRAVVRSVVHR